MTDTSDRDQQMHDVESAVHRASCAECAVVWADLDRISAEAAQLPRLTPSRDLWPEIEARIEMAATATTAPRLARRAFASQPMMRLAVAASLLVAVTSGVTWRLATSAARTGTDIAATVPTATDDGASADASLLSQASFPTTAAALDREIAALEELVAERHSLLDPRTVTVLEQNLALIDQAITESRKALEADPASRFLAAQYARAYTSKLTLLRDAATLPTGI